MKTIIISLILLTTCIDSRSQELFDVFIKKFKSIQPPLEEIKNLTNSDTLNGRLTNDIIIRKQAMKPQYLDLNGNLKTIEQYYGLYPEEPSKYGYEDKQLYFITKIEPIGRVDMNSKYKSLIIKVVGFETTFYDLWNFSNEGKALSVVCLFWGMRDGGPRNEKVTYTIVDSKITKEGNIIWHENNRGLETFRTYKLNSDGYFQISSEEKKGEFEY